MKYDKNSGGVDLLMKNKVIDMMTKAKNEDWPFPKTFNALQELGVLTYRVSWENGYQSLMTMVTGECINEDNPEWFTQPEIHTIYSEAEAKKALKMHQLGETNFLQWMHDMAHAGVTSYLVTMSDRTVMYYSHDKTASFVEMVP